MARVPKQPNNAKQEYLSDLAQVDEDELAAVFLDQDEPPIDFDDEVIRERRLHNDDIEQDIKLKRRTLLTLFIFLAVETALIFLFAFLQGIQWLHLEEWSFRLLISATLAQIAAMLFVAIRYLFPKK